MFQSVLIVNISIINIKMSPQKYEELLGTHLLYMFQGLHIL